MPPLHPELDRVLAARINPERSRRFQAEQFESNLSLLEEMAHRLWPEPRGLRVAVVGSNGKGSTAHYLSRLFQQHLIDHVGPRVGLYASPHLLDVCERISVDGRATEAELIVRTINSLSDHEPTENRFSYFEILTLAALSVFFNEELPVQIYEAGLGGRLDATRVARAEHVLVTAIAPEHAAILGRDPERIIREKLGICTNFARTVLVMPQMQLTDQAVRAAALEICPQVKLVLAPRSLFAPPNSDGSPQTYLTHSLRFAQFCFREMVGREPPSMEKLPGPPGRLECHDWGGRVLCYDTAHNQEALRTTAASLRALAAFSGPASAEVFFACLPDRDPASFRSVLAACGFRRVVQVLGPEFAPPVEQQAGEVVRVADLAAAIRESPATFVLITGTHRLYAEFRRFVRQS